MARTTDLHWSFIAEVNPQLNGRAIPYSIPLSLPPWLLQISLQAEQECDSRHEIFEINRPTSACTFETSKVLCKCTHRSWIDIGKS